MKDLNPNIDNLLKQTNKTLDSAGVELFNYLYQECPSENIMDVTGKGNGTGYFDDLLFSDTEKGKLYKFKDEFGRRGLVRRPKNTWEPGYGEKNIVIFERRLDNPPTLILQNRPGPEITEIYFYLSSWLKLITIFEEIKEKEELTV